MKKRILAAVLLLSALITLLSGCAGSEKASVAFSDNYSFSDEMILYMLSYTATSMEDELRAEGCDLSKPLASQFRENGESFADFVAAETAENLKMMLSYSEAALRSRFTVSEGMIYRSSETLSYLSTIAAENGMTEEQYAEYAFGKGVTPEAYRLCLEMMTLCEGYDLYLFNSIEVTDEQAAAYADEHADKFLHFDCLRYTVKDKATAESLAATTSSEEFVSALKKISGISITDSDKNGIPDVADFKGLSVENDSAADFATAEGRQVFDTHIAEIDGAYTVTMLLSIPKRDTTDLWDFRALFLSEEKSEGSFEDCTSLLQQLREKGTGEEGFANLAYRYSENAYAYYGGLYSGVPKAGMPATSVREWICDPARKNGDMVAVADGSVGSYMLYFLNGPTEAWLYDARAEMKRNAADDIYETSLEDGSLGEFTIDTERLISMARDFMS